MFGARRRTSNGFHGEVMGTRNFVVIRTSNARTHRRNQFVSHVKTTVLMALYGGLRNSTCPYLSMMCKGEGTQAKEERKVKRFPPIGPLDNIVMDLLVPLPKTKNSNQNKLVIEDRYRKLRETSQCRRKPHHMSHPSY